MGSGPNWARGYVPSAAEWQTEWVSKQDQATSLSASANFAVPSTATVIYIDCTGGPFTATLSATPATMETHTFVDVTGQCGSHAFSVDPNGNNLNGTTGARAFISFPRGFSTIQWTGSTNGWVIVA